LQGHGLRARTVITGLGERPKITEVLARRYVCLVCGAVVLVVPAEVARRHLYTLCVIAAALAKWSHGELSASAVRAELGAFSIVGDAATGWPSLIRWSFRSEKLWPRIGPPPSASPRSAAHAISARLAAHAPVPSGHVVDDSIAGSVHAA
jgi:hypothetical protein